jgi:hypothetical protein
MRVAPVFISLRATLDVAARQVFDRLSNSLRFSAGLYSLASGSWQAPRLSTRSAPGFRVLLIATPELDYHATHPKGIAHVFNVYQCLNFLRHRTKDYRPF